MVNSGYQVMGKVHGQLPAEGKLCSSIDAFDGAFIIPKSEKYFYCLKIGDVLSPL